MAPRTDEPTRNSLWLRVRRTTSTALAIHAGDTGSVTFAVLIARATIADSSAAL